MQLLLKYQIGECHDCGRPIYFGDEYHYDEDANEICIDCINEDYSKCDCCGTWIKSEDLRRTSDGDWVCPTCLEQSYFLCYDCEEYHPIDEQNELGGESFCDGCYDDWYVCDDCEELINSRRISSITTHSGDTICDDCYCDHYFTCDDCGEVFYDDCYHYDEGNDCRYCTNCWEQHENRNCNIFDYHKFGRSRYYPCVLIGEKTYKTLLYGVELECDDGEFDHSDFEEWTNDDNLIHFEHDGSLSDSGVEMITMPCSLKFHQQKMEWEKLLSVLKTQGFKSHYTDTCGLHVHISRSMLSPVTICKMDVFVNKAESFFGQIARRENPYHCSYDIARKLSVMKGQCCRGDRYQAINTTNSETVEIRIFKGTLKYQTVIGTIELCDALVHFLEYLPIGKIYETDENVVKFVDWCGERSDIYPHIIPMMKQLVREGNCVSNIDYWFNKIIKKQEVRQCA